MLHQQIEIKATPENVVELLFELDNQEVAKVFKLWKLKFDEGYEERKKNNEPIWIFDLSHFFMYVVKDLDEDGRDLVRSMYSSVLTAQTRTVIDKYRDEQPLII